MFGTSLSAQYDYRDFFSNDSTFYAYNSDSTIVAGKTKLYWNSPAGLNLINDFTVQDTTFYIRDFDAVTDSLWYTIVGDHGWTGDNLQMFKSEDKGINWEVDTSYFAATKLADSLYILDDHNDLNRIIVLSTDTLLLFVGYYQSGIFYSIDGGTNWQLWFGNLIVNYRGIFECGNETYLWGIEGDAFAASMFKFPSHLLLSPDTSGVWTNSPPMIYHPDCYNGNNVNCVYSFATTSYDQFLYFRNYVDSVCTVTTGILPEDSTPFEWIIFPNPSNNGVFYVEINSKYTANTHYTIFSIQGKILVPKSEITDSFLKLDLSYFSPGVYFIAVESSRGKYIKKIVI